MKVHINTEREREKEREKRKAALLLLLLLPPFFFGWDVCFEVLLVEFS